MALTDAAFMAEIVECPDDDTPRLVYADWLDDHGEPDRAELIRAQCRLATLPADAPEQKQLIRRCGELLTRHEDRWRAALPELEGVSWVDFSRGFVEAAFVESPVAFLTHAPAIFAAAPIRRLQVGRIDHEGAIALSACRDLARLTELNLGNNPELGREGVRALAGSPHLARLTVLLLHYCDLGDEAIRLLARSTHLGRLRELYLSDNDLFDESGQYLGEAEGMPSLTDLDLRDNQIGDAGARGLAYSSHRAALRMLYLVNNLIGPGGAEALAWSTSLPHLTFLYLNYNPLGNEGVVSLAESPHRGALRELDLRHCEARDRGGQALASSPFLHDLQALWVGGNRMRLETLTLLRRRFGDRLHL